MKTHKPGNLEAQLAQYTKQALELSGLVFWRVANCAVIHKIGTRTIFKKSFIAGFPDWAGVTPTGIFWALELKSPKGKVSEDQKEWLKKLAQTQALVAVARSVEDVNSFISAVKKL